MTLPPTAGLLLAAGAGTRIGMPKALVRGEGGELWLASAVETLLAADCSPVLVVLGAAADAAASLVPVDERVAAIVAPRWADGMSASLRAGLERAEQTDATAVVITLVDLPGLPVAAVRRVDLRSADASSAVRQATYRGRPGHPVLIGRDHWAPLSARLTGDDGARDYLREQRATEVPCDDLWHGRDVDRIG